MRALNDASPPVPPGGGLGAVLLAASVGEGGAAGASCRELVTCADVGDGVTSSSCLANRRASGDWPSLSMAAMARKEQADNLCALVSDLGATQQS